MLQSIREHTQGWIAGTIITIIILTFALWGIHSYFEGGTGNTNVAEVNGVNISKEQLTVAYERLRRQMQIQYGANSANVKDEADLKGRALQNLINIELLKQASLKQGFLISYDQIDNYLESMPDFQVNGRFSMQRLQDFIASTVLSTSEFLDLIKTSLLIDQPRLGTVFTSFALPNETEYTIALVNQERDIDYIVFPLVYFLLQPITISQDEIKAYYDQHKNDFMTLEQVNIEYLELSSKDLASKITPTETMLKNAYNENINSYTHPTQWKYVSFSLPLNPDASHDDVANAHTKAEEAAKALATTDDVNKLAKQYAANVTTEGWVTLNNVPTELQKAIAELTKPGQVSAPFATTKGLVIVKAIAIQEPQIQPFDTVKEKVRETYVRQHAEEKLAELRDQLADLTYEHPDSLDIAAKTLNLPIQTSELFSKDKPGKDIAQYKKIRDVAFSNDVLTLQNNSDVIQLNPETVLVIRVKSHVPSALLALNSVAKQIEEKLKNHAAEEAAEQFANEFLAKVQAGADPQQLAETYKFSWMRAGRLGRYSTKVDSAILDLAFRLPNPINGSQKIAYGSTRLPNGYAVVALKSVQDGHIADPKQLTVFEEQVQNSEGLLEYELYKQSQTAAAKIKVFASH